MTYRRVRYMNRETAKECVGPGWGGLIDRIYDKLTPDVYVSQVKEKFGGLRFYVGSAPDDVQDFIAEMEEISYTTCEECGAPGKPRGRGWIKTLCDACSSERDRVLSQR